ncbi:MAG: hypothetical protein ABIU11_06505 [Chitinophagaceae bacterium]
MEQQLFKGKISFINYEKFFATIDYTYNNKQKSVNCKTNSAGEGKKPHQYRLGDEVSFELKLSDRGDKMTASNVKFLHNIPINLLIQKAAIENRFAGYLKIIDGRYFIKEWDSYILFPLQLSPWEVPPVATAENEAISYRFLHLDKPNAIMAELFSHNYIPEYKKALQHFNNEIDTDAIIYKISLHGIYLNLFNDKIQAKLPLEKTGEETIKEGDTIRVMITHLTNSRIIVKKVS